MSIDWMLINQYEVGRNETVKKAIVYVIMELKMT